MNNVSNLLLIEIDFVLKGRVLQVKLTSTAYVIVCSVHSRDRTA